MKHESKTFENVAKARAGYFQAAEQFEALAKNPKTPVKDLTKPAPKPFSLLLHFRYRSRHILN